MTTQPHNRRRSQKHWAVRLKIDKRIIGGLAVGGLTAFSYAWQVEPRWLEVTRHKVVVPHLAAPWQGFRVAWLSDLHIGAIGALPMVKAAIKRTIAEQPDLVLIGGDFFDQGKWKPAGEVLGDMAQAGLPVLAVLGNHDYFGNRGDPAKIVANLEKVGVKILLNTVQPIERGGVRHWVAGVDDTYKGVPDLKATLDQITDEQRPLIFMTHSPNYVTKLPAYTAELVLSGHTHGGQINPALPPFRRSLNWIKWGMGEHSTRFPQEWYTVNGNRLYVGRGVGVTRWPLRFNSRPELAIFEFAAE